MANPIVIVSDSISQAPAPSTLQQTGAFISQGGTTEAIGSLTLLTAQSSLTAILNGALAVTSLSQSAGLATCTTTAAHGIPVGDVIQVVIAGATPSAYNGLKTVTATTTTAFTFAISSGTSSPATGTIVYTLEDVTELTAMNTTFFDQQGIKSVYVLELGPGQAADGITALAAYITANPKKVYSWLVPSEWDGAGLVTFVNNYTAANAQVYFWITTTTGNQALYAGKKSAIALVPAPGAPATEFTMAWPFNQTLGWNPSSSQQVPPLEYNFGYGVTEWSPFGNTTNFANFATNKINYAADAGQGGLSDVMLIGGNTQDGNPFNFWYSVDWVSINTALAATNTVINGSNSVPYLYYNQQGINRLQASVFSVMNSAVTYGLAVGTVIKTNLPFATFAANVANGVYAGQVAVNAEPFITYTTENPNDYAIGKYGGLSVAYSPARGFDQVLINVNASTFIA